MRAGAHRPLPGLARLWRRGYTGGYITAYIARPFAGASVQYRAQCTRKCAAGAEIAPRAHCEGKCTPHYQRFCRLQLHAYIAGFFAARNVPGPKTRQCARECTVGKLCRRRAACSGTGCHRSGGPASHEVARGPAVLVGGGVHARAVRRKRTLYQHVGRGSLTRRTALRRAQFAYMLRWWRRGESNSGPRKPPDRHLQAQSLV